jgi:electron transfer flavoprotein alpha subunit
MATLLLADHHEDHLGDATAKALTAALQISKPVHILIAGASPKGAADEAAKLDGVEKVLVASGAHYAHGLAEPITELLLGLMDGYDALVASSSTTGKNILPRVAAKLDMMQISDISKVEAPDTFERPVYAGNALQTVRSTDAKKIVTVRTAAFAATGAGGPAAIEEISAAGDPGLSSFVGEALTESNRPELGSAKIIVSGGRALGSAEKFKEVIEPLADQLGAAIGASRAAVDAGYAPNDQQVGQTGKVVAPQLYLALGISGAIQHLAGMKDSKVIVAINKDEEAPIFQVADYGLVADLFTAVPELREELAKAKR